MLRGCGRNRRAIGRGGVEQLQGSGGRVAEEGSEVHVRVRRGGEGAFPVRPSGSFKEKERSGSKNMFLLFSGGAQV